MCAPFILARNNSTLYILLHTLLELYTPLKLLQIDQFNHVGLICRAHGFPRPAEFRGIWVFPADF